MASFGVSYDAMSTEASTTFPSIPYQRSKMSRLRVSLDEIVPIKQAVRALPRALDRLERSEAMHLVITRRNEPRAVLITVVRYERLLAAWEQVAPTELA